MATYVNDLRLKEIATGDESGTWGTSTNTNLELIGEALGYGTEAVADASTHTITMADGATDGFRCTFLRLTGGGQACTVTLAPNTLSHTWVIRNTTSYALTFTQGSGANVIIAAGLAKMVTTDGAGSGAVVYECLEDLELGGTLTVGIDDTGQDVKFFGATSGSYMLWDESADDLKLVGAAGLTVAGDIDVDGTANLDIVDIDGAVDMASTLAVAGVLTGASLDISGDIDIDGISNLDVVDIDGAVDMASTLAVAGVLTGASLDISGDIDVDGTSNLDIVDVDGAVNMATTALVTGVLTTTATQVATGGITSGSSILSDTDSTDSLGSTGVRWLKGWFDTLTAGTLTIGSGSVTDSSGAISFGNENLTTTGIVTAAGTSVFTNLDISGDVDVDGTTNIDVLDVDGAVDMASTLAVGGIVTAPAQPAFNAYPASTQSNIAINTTVTIVLGTEAFDQGSNFASNTFTAPVTGKYQLNLELMVNAVDSAAGFYQIQIVTTNKSYNMTFDPNFAADTDYWCFTNSVLADMDASDTAVVKIYQSGGTAQTDIDTGSVFSGYLAC